MTEISKRNWLTRAADTLTGPVNTTIHRSNSTGGIVRVQEERLGGIVFKPKSVTRDYSSGRRVRTTSGGGITREAKILGTAGVAGGAFEYDRRHRQVPARKKFKAEETKAIRKNFDEYRDHYYEDLQVEFEKAFGMNALGGLKQGLRGASGPQSSLSGTRGMNIGSSIRNSGFGQRAMAGAQGFKGASGAATGARSKGQHRGTTFTDRMLGGVRGLRAKPAARPVGAAGTTATASTTGSRGGNSFYSQNKGAFKVGGAIAGGAAIGGGGTALATRNKQQVRKNDMSEIFKAKHKDRAQAAGTSGGVGGAIAGPLGGGIGGAIYGSSQGKKGRKAAVAGRVGGRSFGEGLLGSSVGYGVGAATRNPTVAVLGATAGGISGTTHGAYAAGRNASKRGDLKKNDSTSAFGIEH